MGRIKEVITDDVVALERFIKNKSGEKVENKTTSINLEKRHHDFLKERNLNLSAMVRDMLERLMSAEVDFQDK